MDEVITFDKSFQQRFQEFMDVLSGYEVLSANQVKKEWGFYLELVIDPNGWQAVWKIPRNVCEKLKILYPTVVLVYIESVNIPDLTAFVKVLAVQDDIHLPESHIVPLMQLWPTKHQDDTLVGLNLHATANAIDMLHFFYNYLWMPWDVDDEENADWISKHLEIRLRLHYDIKMGLVPRNIAERYRSLVAEAKSLQTKRERLEEELSDEDDIDYDFSPNQKIEMNESVQTLTNLQIRMSHIKIEVEILENPVLRAVMLRQIKETADADDDNDNTPQYWLIFKTNSSVDDHIEYLRQVKESFSPETKYKTATTFQKALETCNPKDIIILSAGQHSMRSVCGLEEGGTIKSLQTDNLRTEIVSRNENIMFDFSGENVVIENLSINVGMSQCGIVIRRGRVKIINCTLTGKGDSFIHQGIVILPEAELHIENCNLSGFATAIVVNSKSKINMQNVTISDVEYGVKMFDKCSANMHQCSFSVCKQYGVYVEKDIDFEDSLTGDINILET